MIFKVIAIHKSEYPDPIHFKKGDQLFVGKKYIGIEAWDNWYFCKTTVGLEGWVPKQIIQWIEKDKVWIATKNYTARELDVAIGDQVIGKYILNGWIWCNHLLYKKSGWVPFNVLQIYQ
ncbi:SH3 domain-containing protein [Acinetobacter nectaris]|uniref:SH3 domain-containing protein n=1 Tax=Acinetobacter nectaris TaxID=1219382 RepID=UPI001F185501|nr:SH3 domain-containing protein [Acinetobacter nectaris]MCF9047406.1 hypothetical protein [Acinetobacter nectaris]